MKRCVVCGEIVEDGVEVCPVCKAKKFEPITGEKTFVCEHVVGDGKVEDKEIMEEVLEHLRTMRDTWKEVMRLTSVQQS